LDNQAYCATFERMHRLAYFFVMLLVGLAMLAAIGSAFVDASAPVAWSFTVLFLVAFGASVVTLVVARLAWRGWTSDLERALTGDGSGEFQPLLRDLRSLLDSVGVRERDASTSQRWDPQRLRAALKKHLRGERVVILANREPYVHEKSEDGMRVLHPASGLVTALEPVMRACSGVWVAHGSGSADR
jgi:trehalose 6-phosphate synthase